MTKLLPQAAVEAYRRDGFYSPVRVMSAADAQGFRAALEAHEAKLGQPLQGNWRHKTHLLFTWVDELVHHPKISTRSRTCSAPNPLLDHEFLHQGGEQPRLRLLAPGLPLLGARAGQVMTAWVALSPAVAEANGCMKLMPGSQTQDRPAAARRHLPQGQSALARPGDRGQGGRREDGGLHPATPARCRCTTSSWCTARSPTAPTTVASAWRSATSRPTSAAEGARFGDARARRRQDGNFDHEPRPERDLDEAALAAHADAVSARSRRSTPAPRSRRFAPDVEATERAMAEERKKL